MICFLNKQVLNFQKINKLLLIICLLVVMDTAIRSHHYHDNQRISFLREQKPQIHHLEQYSQIGQQFVQERMSPLKINLNKQKDLHQKNHSHHIIRDSAPNVLLQSINHQYLPHFHDPRPISHEIDRGNSRIIIHNKPFVQQRIVMEPHVEKKIVMQPHIQQKLVMRPIVRSRIVHPYFSGTSIQPQQNNSMIYSESYYPINKRNQDKITNNSWYPSEIRNNERIVQKQIGQVNTINVGAAPRENIQLRSYQNDYVTNYKKSIEVQQDSSCKNPYCLWIILVTCCVLLLIALLLGLLFAFSYLGSNKTVYSNGNATASVDEKHYPTTSENNINNLQANATFVTNNKALEQNDIKSSSETNYMYGPQTENNVGVTDKATTYVSQVQQTQHPSTALNQQYLNTAFEYKPVNEQIIPGPISIDQDLNPENLNSDQNACETPVVKNRFQSQQYGITNVQTASNT